MEDYLYKINEFLPIDDAEIAEYYNKLNKTIIINYINNEYQFAYIGVHLLFMTYLYYAVWQISKMSSEMYGVASLFVRPFNNTELNFDDIQSVFDYKDIPEKDIINFLHLAGIDKSYLGILKKQIKIRNGMAHASGDYDILEEEPFQLEINNVISIIKKCNKNICENLLLNEYSNSLYLYFAKGKNFEIEIINNFVDNKFITELSLSCEEIKYLVNISKKILFSNFKHLSDKQCVNLKKAHLLICKICNSRYLS